MIYELWNTRTRNLVDSFSTEAAALSAVRKIIEANGPEYARHLALAQEDSRGKTRLIAAGTDLVAHMELIEAATRPAHGGPKRPRRLRSASERSSDSRPAVYVDDRSNRSRLVEEERVSGYQSDAIDSRASREPDDRQRGNSAVATDEAMSVEADGVGGKPASKASTRERTSRN